MRRRWIVIGVAAIACGIFGGGYITSTLLYKNKYQRMAQYISEITYSDSGAPAIKCISEEERESYLSNCYNNNAIQIFGQFRARRNSNRLDMEAIIVTNIDYIVNGENRTTMGVVLSALGEPDKIEYSRESLNLCYKMTAKPNGNEYMIVSIISNKLNTINWRWVIR